MKLLTTRLLGLSGTSNRVCWPGIRLSIHWPNNAGHLFRPIASNDADEMQDIGQQKDEPRLELTSRRLSSVFTSDFAAELRADIIATPFDLYSLEYCAYLTDYRWFPQFFLNFDALRLIKASIPTRQA